MVISGKTRGNGQQLAHYLISMGENERVQILEVAGRLHASDDYLLQTMKQMSLTSELAKGAKGFHHAEINPAYGEDRAMTQDNWLQAADILGNELGLQDQRRVIVLHEKKDRIHAHVVWERYDTRQGKMISDSFSRLAQDRARKEMELVFNHKQTPHRNRQRPELKEAMTNIWNQTETGAEFIKTVYDNGYMVAEGIRDRPFMVVDENGRSFNLTRQIKGVRTKDIRQRLRNEKLTPEKDAIEIMRNRQKGKDASGKSGQQDTTQKIAAQQVASAFAASRNDATRVQEKIPAKNKRKVTTDAFTQSSQDVTENQSQEKKKTISRDFASNRNDLFEVAAEPVPEIEKPEQDKKPEVAQAFAENRQMDGSTLSEEEEIRKLVEEQKAGRERIKHRKMRMR